MADSQNDSTSKDNKPKTKSANKGRWQQNRGGAGRSRPDSETVVGGENSNRGARENSAQKNRGRGGGRGGHRGGRSSSNSGGARAKQNQQSGRRDQAGSEAKGDGPVKWNVIFDKILIKHDGATNFLSIRPEFPESMSNNDISAWFRSQPNSFRIVESESGEIARIQVYKKHLGLCSKYKTNKKCDDPNCRFLHVCPDFIVGSCRGECARAHDFQTPTSKKILEQNKLSRYADKDVVLVVRYSVPTVCSHYNTQSCKYGNRCSRFHVCGDFVRGSCKKVCPKEHSLDNCQGLVKSFNLEEKPDNLIYRLMIVPSIPQFFLNKTTETLTGAKPKLKDTNETGLSEAELRAKIELEIKEQMEAEMKEKIATAIAEQMKQQSGASAQVPMSPPLMMTPPVAPVLGHATSFMQQQMHMQMQQQQMQMQDNLQKQFQMQQQEMMFKQMQEMMTKQMQEQMQKQQQEITLKQMEKHIQQTMEEKLTEISLQTQDNDIEVEDDDVSTSSSNSRSARRRQRQRAANKGQGRTNKPKKDDVERDKGGKLPNVKVTPGKYAKQTSREPEKSESDSDGGSDDEATGAPLLSSLKDPLHNKDTPIDCLCELSQAIEKCPNKQDCPKLHYKCPYLWQIFMDKQWLDLKDDNVKIEQSYCSPDAFLYSDKVTTTPKKLLGYDIDIDFTNMEAKAVDAEGNKTLVLDIRRLSTKSWEDASVDKSSENVTQWTWYMQNNETKQWLKFSGISGAPSNKLIEDKFLSGSPRIRYRKRQEEDPYRIDFSAMLHLNEVDGTECLVRRRPIFAAK